MFTMSSASISALTTVIATQGNGEGVNFDFVKFMAFVGIGMVMNMVYMFIHDILIKQIYCAVKKKKDNRKKCYFWNCKHWRECPYNERIGK